MRRKQVIVLILSGMLTLGSVSPIMAAEAGTPSVTEGMTVRAQDTITAPVPAPAAQQKTAEPTPAADASKTGNTVSSLVSDDALCSMSASLTAMIDQSLEFYNSMNADEKAAISIFADPKLNVPDRIILMY